MGHSLDSQDPAEIAIDDLERKARDDPDADSQLARDVGMERASERDGRCPLNRVAYRAAEALAASLALLFVTADLCHELGASGWGKLDAAQAQLLRLSPSIAASAASASANT
jgi:hypothetical protein